MWKPENREHFELQISDLLDDPEVLALKDMSQHSKKCNRFDHSLYVAYLSFLMCRRLRLDYRAAARGGLLHDFHFGSEEDGVKRLWKHPHHALENATGRHLLTEKEKDIIVKHMWPLTRPLPRHRESFIVSLADKVCAVMEFSRLFRLFRVQKKLVAAVDAA